MLKDKNYNAYIKKISLEKVNISNIKVTKDLHKKIFPVFYPESFYHELIQDDDKSAYLIRYTDYIGVVSIIYLSDHVYIMTFGLLDDFRRKGIGSFCLDLIESFIYSLRRSKIFLHVQVSNEVACLFYRKKGYRKIKKEIDYYESLVNKNAYLFYKNMNLKKKSNYK